MGTGRRTAWNGACSIASSGILDRGFLVDRIRCESAVGLAALIEADARRFRHIPANQLALNKLLINQAFENMGLRTTQLVGTLFDGIARHTEEAYRWAESFSEKGFREAIRERDAPWRDYGERPKD